MLAWAARDPGSSLDPGRPRLQSWNAGLQSSVACLLGQSYLARKRGFLPAPNPGSCWEAWLASPSFPVLAIPPRPRQRKEHVGLRLEETPSIQPETGSSWLKCRAFKITQMN